MIEIPVIRTSEHEEQKTKKRHRIFLLQQSRTINNIHNFYIDFKKYLTFRMLKILTVSLYLLQYLKTQIFSN